MRLQAKALTKDNFRPYGDVVETAGAEHFPINGGAIERYHDLAEVELGGEQGRALISIFRCSQSSELPYRVRVMERHPVGSQAFIPLSRTPMVVVVGRPGDSVRPDDLEAFLSDGAQGVNYRPGVWHMPLIAFEQGREFLVVDRGGPGNNCDEVRFDDVEIIVECAPGTNS